MGIGGGIGLGVRYSEQGRVVYWTPALVLMRLLLMADVARRIEEGTARPGPRGHGCSMPSPPAGVDWESKNGYSIESGPLRPVPPSDVEHRLHEETVMLVAMMPPTDRVILWGAAVGKSWRRIAKQLKANQGMGTQPMSYEGVRRRFYRVVEGLAATWNAEGRPVDAESRTRLLTFDMKAWMLGAPKRKTKGRAFSNGFEIRLGTIQAAEVDQDSMRQEDLYFRRREWSAQAPKVGRDGVMRSRKNGVVKVDKKA
ncbi:MAG: hypothetical protein AB7R90_19410 [Reyranellaceae bacterium]